MVRLITKSIVAWVRAATGFMLGQGGVVLVLALGLGGTYAQDSATGRIGMFTPGVSTVSQSGEAVYQIPIRVPPGVGEMTPKLELAYRSGGGDGLVGLGWTLSGLSSIGRCPPTKMHDGLIGMVTFSATDRFCLDGQRLILVQGTYGAAGSEYRTERESFSKITFDGVAFVAQTRAGLKVYFGSTEKSRLAVSAGVMRWAQSRTEDRLGNYIAVTYEQDATANAQWPVEVRYAGVGSTTGGRVSFDYADRGDVVRSYYAGVSFGLTKRLTSITAYHGATLAREYRLTYLPLTTSVDKNRLTEVTECATASNCLPSTRINWGDAGASGFAKATKAISMFGTNDWWTSASAHPRHFVDLNGDGVVDLVGFGHFYDSLRDEYGTYVAQGLDLGAYATGRNLWSPDFVPSSGWMSDESHLRVLSDVNGDGLPDVVGFFSDGVRVALNTGTSFAPSTLWLANKFFGSSATFPRYLIDISGDGLVDVVGFDGSGLLVALNTGTGSFGAANYWISNQFGTQQSFVDTDSSPRFVIDVTGDGLPDIVGVAPGGVLVALNSMDGFVLPNYACPGGTRVSGFSCVTTYSAAKVYTCPAGYSLVDMNVSVCSGGPTGELTKASTLTYTCFSGGQAVGDTCVTVVVAQAAFSCPAGFKAEQRSCVSLDPNRAGPTSWELAQFGANFGWRDSKYTPRLMADMNGDGLPDLVGFAADGVYVALNTGAGFMPPEKWVSGFGTASGWTDTNVYPRFVADVNADGLPDVVALGADGVSVALNTGSGFLGALQWNATDFSPAAGWVDNSSMPRELVDVNGDGLPDLVGFGKEGLMVSLNTGKPWARMVNSIREGAGREHRYTYKPTTDTSVYAKDTGAQKAAFPVFDLPGGRHLLATYEKTDGVGGFAQTTYKYGGLKAEAGTGRGVLGFRWILSTDQSTGLQHYDEYRQDWPYIGRAALHELRLSGAGSGGVLRRDTNTIACKVPDTGASCTIPVRCDLKANLDACKTAVQKRYFLFDESIKEEKWDLNGASYPAKITSNQYAIDSVDGKLYGDLLSTQINFGDGSTRTQSFEYYPTDTSNWILGRVKKATTTGTNTQ